MLVHHSDAGIQGVTRRVELNFGATDFNDPVILAIEASENIRQG